MILGLVKENAMDLETTKNTLKKLYSGDDACYEVPEYQRDYSWTSSEIEDLWDDLYNAWKVEDEYFMGVLVLCKKDSKDDIYEVVDGQQRLATFAVLCSVLRCAATHYQANQGDSLYQSVTDKPSSLRAAKKAESVAANALREEVDERVYLKLNKKDDPFFNKHIVNAEGLLVAEESRQLIKNENRLIKAKKLLTEKLIKTFYSVNNPYALIELERFTKWIISKAIFVVMKVESGYDAYLLFESLNSKGLELSVSDLLKNKFLQLCDKDAQDRILTNWNEMMANLTNSRFSNSVEFLRMYWCAFEEKITKKDLYRKVKKRLESAPNVETFVENFNEVSEYYADITHEKCLFPVAPCDVVGGAYFSEISALRYSICYPLFMYAHRAQCDYIEELSRCVLNYLFRVITIADYSVGKADDAMTQAIEKMKNKSSKDEVLACFKEEMLTDELFKKYFKTKVYKNNNLAKYVLTKYHLHLFDKETIPNQEAIHLEHILPQQNKPWNFDPGNVGIETWVYNIGNMTLINERSNRKAYNKLFSKKVELYRPKISGEDVGTSFSMTSDLYLEYKNKPYEWTTERIADRANKIAEAAVEIWPL